jgi:hypothetical protein
MCEDFLLLKYWYIHEPIPVAAVFGSLLVGIVGSNPTGVTDVCVFWTFVLSGRGLCDGSIPRLEESYQERVC